MKRIFLLYFSFAVSHLLSAQGWVYLQREGTAGKAAVHCADEGTDGYIYGIAEIEYDPFFVKLDPDGELIATQSLPTGHYYSKFQKLGDDRFIGWGHNVVAVFDPTGNIIWSQDFPDGTVKHVNSSGDKVLVLTNESGMPYHILRFQTDGSTDGDISFSTSTQCLFVDNDSNNGFIVAGNYPVDPNNSKPAFLKIDNSGGVTQEIQLSGFPAASIKSVTELPDGGYAMIGLGWSASNSGIRGHVVKVSPALTEEWVKMLPDQFQGERVFVSADGEMVAVGWGVQSYLNAVKINMQGTLQWSRLFFKSNQSILFDGVSTSDGGFLLMGQLFGGIAIGVGRVLIKTDSSGLFYSHTIKGKVYADTNSDCALQSGEPLAPDVQVSVRKNYTELLRTGDNGIFYALADTGAYIVKSGLPGPYWSLCTDSVVVQVGAADTATVDLLLLPEVACPRMEVSLGCDRIRPCFSTTYYIRYANTGTIDVTASTVLLETHPLLTFVEASVPLLGQQGATGYIFGIGDVEALKTGTFWVKMQTSCDLTPGDMVCADAHIFPDTVCTTNDPDSTFFLDTWCRVATASFDPNAKTAYPPGTGAEHLLAPGTEIGYVIDFQNTGTDTAFNVIIYDTLSPWLDAHSVQPVVASHSYTMERSGERILKFIFHDILLPDSNTNEAASHGFVKYFVRPEPYAPIGTVIPNRAAIYFDFNAPIFTETYFHTLGLPVSATKQPDNDVTGLFSLSPNPADNILRIDAENWPDGEITLSIHNTAGTAFYLKNIAKSDSPIHQFDVSGWPAGLYFVTLESSGKPKMTKKLVILGAH